MRGGYTTADWVPSDPVGNPTTLDAQGLGRVLYITGTITPTIEGLRLTGGDASGLGGYPPPCPFNPGGGVYVSGGSGELRCCWVFGNNAGSGTSEGGGFYLHDTTFSVKDCEVFDNHAGQMGAG